MAPRWCLHANAITRSWFLRRGKMLFGSPRNVAYATDKRSVLNISCEHAAQRVPVDGDGTLFGARRSAYRTQALQLDHGLRRDLSNIRARHADRLGTSQTHLSLVRRGLRTMYRGVPRRNEKLRGRLPPLRRKLPEDGCLNSRSQSCQGEHRVGSACLNSFSANDIKWRSLSFFGCRVLVSEYLNKSPKQPSLKTLQDTLAAR